MERSFVSAESSKEKDKRFQITSPAKEIQDASLSSKSNCKLPFGNMGGIKKARIQF